MLRLRAHAGLDGSSMVDARLALTDPQHAGDAVAVTLSTGESSVRYRVTGMPRDWPLQDCVVDFGAVLTLPLRVNDVLVGVFVIGAAQADAFAPVETRVFREMAVELGLGIQVQRTHAARLLAERDLRANLQ